MYIVQVCLCVLKLEDLLISSQKVNVWFFKNQYSAKVTAKVRGISVVQPGKSQIVVTKNICKKKDNQLDCLAVLNFEITNGNNNKKKQT